MAEQKIDTFLPDPSRFISGGVGRALSDLGDLGSDALELIYGKERTEKIEGALSDALKFIDDNLDKTAVGKATTQALEKTFFPKDLSPIEEVGAELVSYAIPGTAATKLLKADKAKTRLGKAVRYGVAGVIADVIAKDENEQHLKPIMELVNAKGINKEVDELVNKLDINPNDTVAERLLKQTIDSAGLSVALGIPLAVIFKVLKFGGAKAIGKAKAVKNKINTPIQNTNNKIVSDAKVIENKPGKYLQQGKISSVIGK